MKSWLPISPQSHFSLANIPFGIISTKSKHRHVPAIAIGNYVLDLSEFASQNGFSSLPSVHPHEEVFSSPTLNAFAALGKSIHTAVRIYLQSVFLDATPFPKVLKENRSLRDAALIPSEDAIMHLPMTIGDYTDFYAGMNHAFNVGVLFRGAANALQPNYKHLPVGYHGRASSVVVSGTPIRRPNGQILTQQSADVKVPSFSACQKLDIELELGAFLCRGSNMGDPVSVDDAESYIFGLVLLNDWSARDIQAWEYVPLGPFNSKNFGTTISPWVVLTDALEPYRTQGLENDVDLLPYLREDKVRNMYDIKLEVDLKSNYTRDLSEHVHVTDFSTSSCGKAKYDLQDQWAQPSVLVSSDARPPYRDWMPCQHG